MCCALKDRKEHGYHNGKKEGIHVAEKRSLTRVREGGKERKYFFSLCAQERKFFTHKNRE